MWDSIPKQNLHYEEVESIEMYSFVCLVDQVIIINTNKLEKITEVLVISKVTLASP